MMLCIRFVLSMEMGEKKHPSPLKARFTGLLDYPTISDPLLLEFR